jgi:hypothetical protein
MLDVCHTGEIDLDDTEEWHAILWWSDDNGETFRRVFASHLRGAVGRQEDADRMAATALTSFTLRSGDTDAEYFDYYTDAQLAWRDTHAESVAILAYTSEDDNGDSLAHLARTDGDA